MSTPFDGGVTAMNDYLDEIKARKGFTSDNQLAQALNVTRQAVSNYRCGKSVPDDYTAAKMAKMLDRAPLELIAAANAARTKSPTERKFWRQLLSTAALAMMALPPAWVGVWVWILCSMIGARPRRCDTVHSRAATA